MCAAYLTISILIFLFTFTAISLLIIYVGSGEVISQFTSSCPKEWRRISTTYWYDPDNGPSYKKPHFPPRRTKYYTALIGVNRHPLPIADGE
jgi:hypothetical protein